MYHCLAIAVIDCSIRHSVGLRLRTRKMVYKTKSHCRACTQHLGGRFEDALQYLFVTNFPWPYSLNLLIDAELVLPIVQSAEEDKSLQVFKERIVFKNVLIVMIVRSTSHKYLNQSVLGIQ